MMKYYTGNHTGDIPGNLPQPYYWWEAGAMFGALIDYWHYTGDSTYNDEVTQGMLFQAGPLEDYMTPNQTKTEGNDDQGFWGLAAMSAAENKFPDPPAGKPQWLALAQAVFNTQAIRWDNQFCNGGLRWQIFTFNTGYDYKNTISNGAFFNLAARLAVYTGNQTYADWAEKTYDWVAAVSLMSPQYHFYDGAHTTLNCTDVNKVEWTYNAGIFLLGASAMYNHVSPIRSQYPLLQTDNIISQTKGGDKWRASIEGILNASSLFFSPQNVMYEQACEVPNNCDTDNFSFKAYLSRWMAASTKFAPFTYNLVMPKLRASAQAAAQQCSGGTDGTTCGQKWTMGTTWDKSNGVGQQMSALEVIQVNLVSNATGPLTNSTGGTSQGNPSAGSGGTKDPTLPKSAITGKDRVGAGFLTTFVIVSLVGGVWWIIA